MEGVGEPAKRLGSRWLTLVLFAAGAALGALLGFWFWLQIYGPDYFKSPLTGAVVVGGADVACGVLFARAAPRR